MSYNDKLGLLARLLDQGLDPNTGLGLFEDVRSQRQQRRQRQKEGLLSLIDAAQQSASAGVPYSGAVGQANALAGALGIKPGTSTKAATSLNQLYGVPMGSDPNDFAGQTSGLYVDPEGGGGFDAEDMQIVQTMVSGLMSQVEGGAEEENYEHIRSLAHQQASLALGPDYEANIGAIDQVIDMQFGIGSGADIEDLAAGRVGPQRQNASTDGFSPGEVAPTALGGTLLGLGGWSGASKLANKFAGKSWPGPMKGLGGLASRLFGSGAGAAAPSAAGAATGAATATGATTAAAEAAAGGTSFIPAAGAGEAGFALPGALAAGGALLGSGLAAHGLGSLAARGYTGAENAERGSLESSLGLMDAWANNVRQGHMTPQAFQSQAQNMWDVPEPDLANSLGLGLFSSQQRWDDPQVQQLKDRYSVLRASLGL